MRIWLLKLDVDKYNSFNGYKIEEELNIRFFGNSVSSNWKEPVIEAYYKKRKIADISDFSYGAPLFNEKAVIILEEFLKANAELLPAYYEGNKYYVVNVINVIDALDYEKSEFERFETGAVMYCNKYSFKSEVVINQHLFKIPICNKIDIFVSDQFKRRVEESKLKGLIFVEVWNSEKASAKDTLETKNGNTKDESENLKPREEILEEEQKKVYPDISEEEAVILQAKIIDDLYNAVLQRVKEIGKNKGRIDSIGIEYFFDGQYTDIGLLVNVLIDPKEDEYEESYFRLLDQPDIEDNFNVLFNHYVKVNMKEEETVFFFGVIQEIILKLNEKIQNTTWQSITEVTKDFSIEDPELYD